MSSWLFGVSATDPFVYVGIWTLLLTVALARAICRQDARTKVDPMAGLRYE